MSDAVYGQNFYSQYPKMTAGGVTNEGDFIPFELWAGECDIVTGQGTAGATALEQFRVISRVGGLLVPWDGVVMDGPGSAIGVTAQAIPAGATGPYFTGGFFNHLALIWPVAVNTLPGRKAAFDGTNINIGAILGVATNITYP